MKTLARLSAIAAAALLAGCTTTFVSPVEVTRFIGDQPQALGSGPIAVRAGVGTDQDSLEASIFRDAVALATHLLVRASSTSVETSTGSGLC